MIASGYGSNASEGIEQNAEQDKPPDRGLFFDYRFTETGQPPCVTPSRSYRAGKGVTMSRFTVTAVTLIASYVFKCMYLLSFNICDMSQNQCHMSQMRVTCLLDYIRNVTGGVTLNPDFWVRIY